MQDVERILEAVESAEDLESAKEDLEPLLAKTMAKAVGDAAKRVAIAKLRKPLEAWLNERGKIEPLKLNLELCAQLLLLQCCRTGAAVFLAN